MNDLTFYFDPICPWTWRTSQWLREVRRQQNLEINWKFFSLAEANNFADQVIWLAPLQVAALVRRRGGSQALDRFYLAFGQASHEKDLDIRAEGAIEQAVKQALSEGGFEASLWQEATQDPTTLADVLADHREATGKFKAYGSPWLVVGDNDFGFNGPIITEVPQGQTALQLWEHTSWLLTQPYLYELKRNRD